MFFDWPWSYPLTLKKEDVFKTEFPKPKKINLKSIFKYPQLVVMQIADLAFECMYSLLQIYFL